MIDWQEIEDRLITAAETGMQATGKQMYARAVRLAPVRKVFQYQKDITKAPAAQARWRAASGRFMSRTTPVGEDDEAHMIHRRNRAFAPNTTIRHRHAQSMADRVIVRFGGGGQEVTRKNVPGSAFAMSGGQPTYRSRIVATQKFGLENPAGKALNVRGRYEMRTGRAFYKNANGTTTLGGRLRGSIRLDEAPEETPTGSTIRLYAGGEEAYYAIYQELGTRHHSAHPFLRPALDEASKYFHKYVSRAVANAGL